MKKRVNVIGLGHTGLVYASCMAKLGLLVDCFDFNKDIIKLLNSGSLPFYEPDLENLVKKSLNRTLFFHNEISDILTESSFIFITTDINYDAKGRLNIDEFERSISLAKKYFPKTGVLSISSQVPLGTTRKVFTEIRSINKAMSIVYFMENLKYGEAIKGFLNPDKVIFGVNENNDVIELKEILNLKNVPIKLLSFEEAEITKQTLNYYLALNISFASEMSDLCERLGLDYKQIVEALKLDKRISKYSPINPGIGFGGTSLQRDLFSLKSLAKSVRYNPSLLEATLKVNSKRVSLLVEKVSAILKGLKNEQSSSANKQSFSANKKIGLLGLTYKPGTSSIRGSIAIDLAHRLIQKKVHLRAFDPLIKDQIKELPNLAIFSDINKFLEGLDLVVILTPDPKYREINPKSFQLMKQKNILDCFGILNTKI